MLQGGAGTGKLRGALALLLATFAPMTDAARADSEHAKTKPEENVIWREVWTGVDATAAGWLVFSGMTVAPFSQIHGEGVRFRMASGYGGYSYAGLRGSETFNQVLGRPELHADLRSFEAQTGFADALAGYLWRLDPLILKVFAGASGVSHEITPFDPENLAVGLDWGPKGVVEMWLNLGEGMWASLDLSWSAAHRTRSARARVGYRAAPQLSLGLEGRLDIDAQGDCDIRWDEAGKCKNQYRNQSGTPTDIFDYSRGGLFARYEWVGGEISAAAGISGAFLGRDGELEPDPYASVSWIKQY